MANKVDFSLKVSAETATRFDAIAGSLRFTREQTLTYLLDLYDKIKPERAGFPRKRPVESHLHTHVQPEIRNKFRQLTQECGLNRDQMLSMLIDIHDQYPECMAGQLTWSAGTGTARIREADRIKAAKAKSDAKTESTDPMAEVEAALDTIRRTFRSMASDNAEVASLREQLARSRAEARMAEAAYRRKLQAVTERLRDIA